MMSLQTLKDEGQSLGSPEGLLIGILDTRPQVDAAVSSLNTAGIEDSELMLLQGQDGVNLIDRSEKAHFSFSDCPHEIARRDQAALADGKYVLAIKVAPARRARALADLLKKEGGHGFAHFGMLVDTRFN